ncbi:MAG: hypothetical protein ABI304_11560 [Rudaea sp.]
MSPTGTPVSITLLQRGVDHFALVAFPRSANPRPHPGRGHNRDSAIADALQCRQVFYGDSYVERAVLSAASRFEKVHLILTEDTLHLEPVTD